MDDGKFKMKQDKEWKYLELDQSAEGIKEDAGMVDGYIVIDKKGSEKKDVAEY